MRRFRSRTLGRGIRRWLMLVAGLALLAALGVTLLSAALRPGADEHILQATDPSVPLRVIGDGRP